MYRFLKKWLLPIFIAFLCARAVNVNAAEISILDSDSIPWESVIVVKNDCGMTHRLILLTKHLEQPYVAEWVLQMSDLCEINNKKETINVKRSKSIVEEFSSNNSRPN